jgi:hypothetical protein
MQEVWEQFQKHMFEFIISLWAPQGCKMVGIGGNFGFFHNEIQNLRCVPWTSMLNMIKTSRYTFLKDLLPSKT